MTESPQTAAPRAAPAVVLWLCAALVVVGLGIRALPIFQGQRIFRTWPTEDGYLMLTIARNIATGKGMTTADGALPTNGTQPLMTFVYAGGFAMVGGDRYAGVVVAHLISIGISLAGALLLYPLGRRLLADHPHGPAIAMSAASLWFFSPIISNHSMNMLETGAYAAMSLGAVLWFIAPSRDADGRWSIGRCLAYGVFLGLTFLTRIDAVFLILGVCLARVLPAFRPPYTSVVRRFAETFVFGAVSIVVASPWLSYNHTRFGSVMPTSGTSQMVEANLGQNLGHVPAKLSEYFTMVIPIPQNLEASAPGLAASLLVVAVAVAAAGVAVRQGTREVRTAVLIVGIFGTCLAAYYGVFFGAGWFLSRYLMPLSPFLFLLSTASIAWVADRLPIIPPRLALSGAATVLVLIGVAGYLRSYSRTADHGHFPVVDWVKENVPEDAWIAAVQTGTLGFFHDRTINLDGKVNPEALRLRTDLKPGKEADRRVDEYILSKGVRFMADWAEPIADYAKHEILGVHFEIVVMDATRGSQYGLGVLRRREAPVGREGQGTP